MKPVIGAVELMTFHHEVLIAFCRHLIKLNLDSVVIAPSQGIQKAINRYAATSFLYLAEQAFTKGTSFTLENAKSLSQIMTSLEHCNAIYIGTFPPKPIASKPDQYDKTLTKSRYQQAVEIIRAGLSQNKPVYVVIHKPLVDAQNLINSLGPSACKQISAIYLSADTASHSQELYPNQFRSELIMPAIGISRESSLAQHQYDAPHQRDRYSRCRMAIVGEISSQRRDYNQLSQLNSHQQWLKNQRIKLEVIGRIKAESWLDKILLICRLPAMLIFLLRYPQLISLWLHGILDLTKVRRSKIAEEQLSSLLRMSACILDLKLDHYSLHGQTSGSEGLSLTYCLPLITIAQVLEASTTNPTHASQPLSDLLRCKSVEVMQKRSALEVQFHKALAVDLQAASNSEG